MAREPQKPAKPVSGKGDVNDPRDGPVTWKLVTIVGTIVVGTLSIFFGLRAQWVSDLDRHESRPFHNGAASKDDIKDVKERLVRIEDKVDGLIRRK